MGGLMRMVGHFPVHLITHKFGELRTRKDRQEKVNAQVDQYLRDGGSLMYFPEGERNANPTTLLPFRYGGYVHAKEHQLDIFGIVLTGTDECWSIDNIVGGFPARIVVEPVKLFPSNQWSTNPDIATVARLCENHMQAVITKRIKKWPFQRRNGKRETVLSFRLNFKRERTVDVSKSKDGYNL